MQQHLALPLLSHWAALYTRRKGSRVIALHRIFADGELEDFPSGEINLDYPFKLIHPDAKYQLRPSQIAMACQLFGPSAECYRIMRLVEDDIFTRAAFHPSGAALFIVTAKDSEGLPSQIAHHDYGEAMARLRGQPELAQEMPTPSTIFKRKK